MKVVTGDKSRKKILSNVFTESMYQDPMYYYIFSDKVLSRRYFALFWEAVLEYTFKYGTVIVTEDYSGVLCLLPPNFTDFSFGQLLKTGFIIPRSILRFPFYQAKMTFDILMELGKHQSEIIPQPHWYLMSLGVLPEEQGKGKGKSLLNQMERIVSQDNKPVYLETKTEKNVQLYKKFGFEVVKEVTLNRYGLKFYLMTQLSRLLK